MPVRKQAKECTEGDRKKRRRRGPGRVSVTPAGRVFARLETTSVRRESTPAAWRGSERFSRAEDVLQGAARARRSPGASPRRLSMFAVAVSTPAFVRTRISRATRAPARRTSRVVVHAAGSDGNAEDEDDLPPPIKLTADQARIAALAFEVLYEKDPREDMEEMLKDKEPPGAQGEAATSHQRCVRVAPVRLATLFLLGSSSSANADCVI